MPKFKVYVVEHITVHYPCIEIEAADADEAEDMGEEMRAQGQLGDPNSYLQVDDVDVDALLVPPR